MPSAINLKIVSYVAMHYEFFYTFVSVSNYASFLDICKYIINLHKMRGPRVYYINADTCFQPHCLSFIHTLLNQLN
jgi:hypothetical protein